MTSKQFEILANKPIYQGFFKLDSLTLRHTLFQGGWTPYLNRELFRRNNCVAVLLYDPDLDKVVLLEQFRVGALFNSQSAWLLEIVAGAIEAGETAEQVAHREVEEEAGCQAKNLQEIMQFYSTPGGSSEKITLYCARVDSRLIGGIHGLQDEGENILVSTVDADEAFNRLEAGLIQSAFTIIAIQWLMLNREKIRKQWLAESS